MLHIVLWKWNQKGFIHRYTAEHVNIMGNMLRRHLKGSQYRILCVTDDPDHIDNNIETFRLWDDYSTLHNIMGESLPSCYRRLKLFDPETQNDLRIKEGDRIAWIDLDTVILRDMWQVFGRKERFVGWAVRGTYRPRVFNGSMVLFTAGDLTTIWSEFNPETSPATAKDAGFLGSDQGWLSYKLAESAEFSGWEWPLVASYPRELMRRATIPTHTAVAFFHGKRKPWHDNIKMNVQWIHDNWR